MVQLPAARKPVRDDKVSVILSEAKDLSHESVRKKRSVVADAPLDDKAFRVALRPPLSS